MQTFIFSATLSKDLQNNLKRQKRIPRKGTKKATALGECNVIEKQSCG